VDAGPRRAYRASGGLSCFCPRCHWPSERVSLRGAAALHCLGRLQRRDAGGDDESGCGLPATRPVCGHAQGRHAPGATQPPPRSAQQREAFRNAYTVLGVRDALHLGLAPCAQCRVQLGQHGALEASSVVDAEPRVQALKWRCRGGEVQAGGHGRHGRPWLHHIALGTAAVVVSDAVRSTACVELTSRRPVARQKLCGELDELPPYPARALNWDPAGACARQPCAACVWLLSDPRTLGTLPWSREPLPGMSPCMKFKASEAAGSCSTASTVFKCL
jgi:hypothetical protein